jgi:tRNA(Ile)-lysidine synthase
VTRADRENVVRPSLQSQSASAAVHGAVHDAVRAALVPLAPETMLVLAVSGGCDSMVMLDAMAHVAPERIAAVATFDHGTGGAATRASALAAARARSLGLPVYRARAQRALRGELAWREARWEFLATVARRAARDASACVATAHTRDDQVETVFMRALRGAGARGLAALAAPSPVLRPLLAVARDDVRAYAAFRQLHWEEDPTNADLSHLRNRVRLELLPALSMVDPALAATLLAVGERAAELRRALDDVVAHAIAAEVSPGRLTVARPELASYDAEALCLIWPALAARARVRLDGRGTRRLAAFTIAGRNGAEIQLAGGYCARVHRNRITVARGPSSGVQHRPSALRHGVNVGRFRFLVQQERGAAAGSQRPGSRPGLWEALFVRGQRLTVRTWQPGDRMIPIGATAPRRVKGVLRDAGVPGAERPGWPVVLAGGEIVWVPGVRRSSAAIARPGRPVVRYRCERLD